MPTKKLKTQEKENLFKILQTRFEKNMNRHFKLDWSKIQSKLEASEDKLWSLFQMEETGGEPDVVGFDEKTGEYLFYDCSLQTPAGRRNLCYDKKALENRKKFPPKSSVVEIAMEMKIELLDEKEYRFLQTLGDFDTKTSSWIKTPTKIRELGGALFGDFRYGETFVYHNGADSYYGSRAFRGCLRI
jgi:Protein of unknown function (DUF4256)